MVTQLYRTDDSKTRKEQGMCVYCKGPDLKDSSATYVAAMDKFTIIIRDVPCQECVQCGEKYYTDAVMQDIETVVKKAIDIQSGLFVTEYGPVV